MDTTQTLIENYLAYCSSQKRLDEKTLKAYRIDLRQFSEQTPPVEFPALSSAALEAYIAALHRQYKPKTVKRKIASVKAFFHYLEYKDILIRNPFNKLQIRFREPAILPKTIPLPVVEIFLTTIYRQRRTATTLYQKRNALRDAAVAELLFATGMRISELCTLKSHDVNLYDGTILIYGKFLIYLCVFFSPIDTIVFCISYLIPFQINVFFILHHCHSRLFRRRPV